jgi:hypothetical protein
MDVLGSHCMNAFIHQPILWKGEKGKRVDEHLKRIQQAMCWKGVSIHVDHFAKVS